MISSSSAKGSNGDYKGVNISNSDVTTYSLTKSRLLNAQCTPNYNDNKVTDFVNNGDGTWCIVTPNYIGDVRPGGSSSITYSLTDGTQLVVNTTYDIIFIE